MIPRPWLRKLFGFSLQRHTITRKGRWARPQMEVLERRLAPTVQLIYTGPGGTLSLTEDASGATPAVTVSESTANLLRIDLGAGNHFDAASTGSAMGLAYSSGTPATSQSATVDIGRADNVPNLAADLAGDTL